MRLLLKNILLLTFVFLFGLPSQNLRVWAQETGEVEEISPSENATETDETPVEEKQAESENEKAVNQPDQSTEYQGDGTVEVEPSAIIPSDLTGNFYLVPYRARRSTWGFQVSLGYSTFEPTLYEPEYSPEDGYESVYNKAETPLMELQMAAKYNMAVGSLTGEMAVGTFVEKSDITATDSQLSIMPIRLGVGYILDTLFLEPYVCPYITAGAYTMIYKEKLQDTSNNGITQAAPYFSAGLQFQLDWIDGIAAREAYSDSGIESTFIFVEGRKFLASSAASDPNFETDIHIDTGLRLEF